MGRVEAIDDRFSVEKVTECIYTKNYNRINVQTIYNVCYIPVDKAKRPVERLI